MTNRGFDWIIGAAFWALAAICLFNLNDVGRMWIGVEEALSVPMLLCSLVALLGLFRVRFLEAVGGLGVLFLAALASYVGIGILVSIFTATDFRTGAWDYLTRYLSSILLVLAAAVGGRIVLQRAGTERALQGVLGLLTASCGLTLASPWLMTVFQNPPEDGTFRNFGVFANPNEAGFVACLAVVLALSFIRTGRLAVLGYGSLLVAAAALVGTYSRTALVALAILLAGGLLASRGRERWRFAGGLVVVGWLLARTIANIDAGILLDPQVERLTSLLTIVESASVDDVTLAGRLTLWQIALEQTLESPLLGSGLGQLHVLEEAWFGDEGLPLGAHNMYLTLWGEAGFIPLLLFILFLAGMLRLGVAGGLDALAAGAVGGWGLVLLLSAMTSHNLLLSRPANFIIGVACAAAVAGYSRGTAAPASRKSRWQDPVSP